MQRSVFLLAMAISSMALPAAAQWQRTESGDPTDTFMTLARVRGVVVGLSCKSGKNAKPVGLLLLSWSTPATASSTIDLVLQAGSERKTWTFDRGAGGSSEHLSLRARDGEALVSWLATKGAASVAVTPGDNKQRTLTIPAGVGSELAWLREKCGSAPAQAPTGFPSKSHERWTTEPVEELQRDTHAMTRYGSLDPTRKSCAVRRPEIG